MTWRTLMTAPLLAAALFHQTPARDGAAQALPGTGTAVVTGTILTGADGSVPARKARVMLGSVDGRVAGLTVATDDAGHFEFHGVPGGRYWVEVQKAGYLLGSYGRTRPGQTGTPVSVADGSRVDGLMIRLVHGAAIAGTVRDTRGRPVPGVTCLALQFGYSVIGERQLKQAGFAMTDDQGEYRFWGLYPGEFVVAVTPRDPHSSGAFPSNDFAVLTAADVDRALQAGPPIAAPAQPAVPAQNYAPVFFPGTADVALARTIVLPAAADRQGIDIVIDLSRTTRVEGVVTTRDGQPVASARVTLTGAGDSANLLGAVFRGWAATSGRDGHFIIQNVWPGTYKLVAVLTSPTSSTWAMSELTASGGTVAVPLTMQPAMTIAGRVVFDGPSAPPSDPTTLGIRLVPAGSGSISASPPGGSVNADGTFSFVGVTPGTYGMERVMRTQMPWSWSIRSATMGNQDALNGPFTIAPGDNANLVLTYTDRPTEVSGQFQDVTGRAATDYFIVVFPADRALWMPGSRRIASTRPDSSGRYVIRGMPSGDYLLAALTDLDPQDLFSAPFFDQLAPLAVKVKLAEGVPAKQDLRVGKVPGPNSEAVKK